MQSDKHHKAPRAVRHGWLGRSMFAVAVLGASLGVGACGSSGGSGTAASPTILNTEKVELAIQHSALSQRGERAQVTCPSGVHQAKGLKFACTATVGNISTRFLVTELNGSGDVHYAGQ